jgi:hypothetical protein
LHCEDLKILIVIANQIPIDRLYDLINVPTVADAILDRGIHNAHRVELASESLHKRHPLS